MHAPDLKTMVSALLSNPFADFNSDDGKAFVRDSARFTEGVLTEAEFRHKWSLTNDDWAAMANNRALTNAVRKERQSRIDSGEAAVEAARKVYARAPHVLATLLESTVVSPRHRIEAARELRAIAGFSRDAGNPPDSERVVITINLGNEDTTVFSGQLRPLVGEPAQAAAEKATQARAATSNIPRLLQIDGEEDDLDD